MAEAELYIGVMSGTSMDGVDTALVSIDEHATTMLAHDFYPMPLALKQTLLGICQNQETSLKPIGELDHQLGHLFADAVNQLLDKSGYQAGDITAIGNHGQTVFHQPEGDIPFTMQLGDANIIAVKTGITTVADFRRKDMALGGQGAPLVPAFHRTIFPPQDSTVVVLNIGGIANISVMQPGKPTLGFDTGPGNTLLDAWVEQHTGKAYDVDAQFARSGTIIPQLLHALLQDPFFSRPAPKSSGREYFNLHWLQQYLDNENGIILPHDVQATLTELSAQSIADDVDKFRSGLHSELLVCGGGIHNPLLINRLIKLLPNWTVTTTTERGVDGDYMEAIAFAWLAQRRIHNLPSNLPEVTGALKATSLGVIYPV
ncbi:anhydro-N-acetylmuramic acid kinase [Vibrio albus]|uniref:Anhydro-N-acetylmuramic acid kinase n=1 Tax=Vibrio albus TaxID=2200953 RepID=A0A2U3BEW9_9VIBR|nr:anhydro-N-acetylmuramic acid kinase [Vibrio albus]PWI35313.1 anhydro-N-acetylmuramic acid kinase [Vibrio albus]